MITCIPIVMFFDGMIAKPATKRRTIAFSNVRSKSISKIDRQDFTSDTTSSTSDYKNVGFPDMNTVAAV